MPTLRPTRTIGNACLGVVGLALGALLLWHRAIPDSGGVMGLVESVLPWIGVLILVLAVVAAVRRSAFIGLGAAASVIVWLFLFLPHVVPAHPDGTPNVTVISQNVDASNPDPAHTVATLAARDPQVIALQELTSTSTAAALAELDGRYPHHYIVGTVGVWSELPLSDEHSLTLGLGWKRALRVDVETADGPVRLYALHAASLRPGEYAVRNKMLNTLTTTLEADQSSKLIALGDFNAASTDRSFTQLLSTVTEPRLTQWGFGFTWPARFPVARVDHVLQRGLTVVSSRVLAANGSDHRAIEVGLN
jgi:vancomycin resistance protein VanJ